MLLASDATVCSKCGTRRKESAGPEVVPSVPSEYLEAVIVTR